MIRLIREYLHAFSALLYPNLCLACGRDLVKGEEVICSHCVFHLPKTYFHNDLENPVAKTFWGRVKVEHATACVYFSKGNNIQQLLHQLKYKGKKEVGIFFGKYFGLELKQTDGFNTVETIIPVPLHKKKLRKRGFNQSEVFAKGLSKSLEINMETDCLYRKTASETQTRKSRFKRWQNVDSIFDIRQAHRLENKHVLLVDDVITTGATMEACVQALQQIPGVKVSVAAIAYASF